MSAWLPNALPFCPLSVQTIIKLQINGAMLFLPQSSSRFGGDLFGSLNPQVPIGAAPPVPVVPIGADQCRNDLTVQAPNGTQRHLSAPIGTENIFSERTWFLTNSVGMSSYVELCRPKTRFSQFEQEKRFFRQLGFGFASSIGVPSEAKRGFLTRRTSKIGQKIALEKPSEAKRR